jgi:exodeoxyribonuclease-3
MNTLRVATYNLLHGGQDGGNRTRLDTALEILREAEPDVVALQEAKGFEREGGRLLFEVENRLGMRGQLALAPRTGQNTAVFVAPALGLLGFEADDLHFHHTAAIATLAAPGVAAEITVISVHLSPLSPETRLAEAAQLAGFAAPGSWTILAGDFNSPGPADPEPGDWGSLPAHFRVRYLNDAGDASDRRAGARLGAAGFVDVAAELQTNDETSVPTRGFPDSEFVPFRSDQVLVTPPLATRAVTHKVLKDDRTDTASDHYPVVVDFDLDRVGPTARPVAFGTMR